MGEAQGPRLIPIKLRIDTAMAFEEIDEFILDSSEKRRIIEELIDRKDEAMRTINGQIRECGVEIWSDRIGGILALGLGFLSVSTGVLPAELLGVGFSGFGYGLLVQAGHTAKERSRWRLRKDYMEYILARQAANS